jgi:hypothetical protein
MRAPLINVLQYRGISRSVSRTVLTDIPEATPSIFSPPPPWEDLADAEAR